MKSIAILGHGTVGSGIFELIQNTHKSILQQHNELLNVEHVLVRDIDKYAGHNSYEVFTTNFDIIKESDCEIVIETIGGINPAYEYVKTCIEKRKHVITANKDLIAEHGIELLALANKYEVSLNYEASVGGGIPILRTIKESLSNHKVKGITGILNGTTNFILSKMYDENLDYQEALKIAQEIGFAEADPSSDVLGFDAARKLSILTRLSMGKNLRVKDVMIEGITSLDAKDIITAKELGYKIKLVAKVIQYDSSIHAFVKPVYVNSNSNLGLINNEYNSIILNMGPFGDMVFSGKGAGKDPTASALFGDLMDILINDKKYQNQDLLPANMTYTLKGEQEWLVRLYSLNHKINLEKIFKFFNHANVEIRNFKDPHDLAFTIKGISESDLLSVLRKLIDLNIISVSKQFMIV